MANDNVTVSATGSYLIGIDSDNDSTTQYFRVSKHVGGTPVQLLNMNEIGDLEVPGEFQTTAGPVILRGFSLTPSVLVKFLKGSGAGTEMASIDPDGKADFNTGGIRTRTNAGTPTGGESGDIVVDTTNSRLYVNVGGTWKYASLT